MKDRRSDIAAARRAILLLCLLATACEDSATGTQQRLPSELHEQPALPVPTAPLAIHEDDARRAAYTRDVAATIAGLALVERPPSGAIGMQCAPNRVTTSAPGLVLQLPAQAEKRRHVLAVVTPERGVLEIYSPYSEDVEEGDLRQPSDILSWTRVRTQSRFALQASELEGLRRNSDRPEPLFLEAGRYRFVLVNGIDPDLLSANGTPVAVIAACSFDWTPQIKRPQ